MKKLTIAATALATTLAIGTIAQAGDTPSPAGAKVYFIGIEDGAKVQNPVTIRFGLSGMGVAPAGTEKEKTGHHHLIINEKIEGDELNEGIPSDDQHIHYGGGQTEVTVKLPVGTHTLQLVLGDQNHIPHNPPVMSERISVTVE